MTVIETLAHSVGGEHGGTVQVVGAIAEPPNMN